MTRTTPDPVFADASRAELERRVRRAGRSAVVPLPRRDRRGVMQLVVTAAVAVLILSVVTGIAQLQNRFVGAPPAPTVVATATAAPSPSPSATTRPTPTSTAPLVVPQGFERRSDAQLRAWAATLPQNAAVDESVWIEQQILIVHCMAGRGFLYDPEWSYSNGKEMPPAGHEQAYEEALYGPETDQPYDWRSAGCTGLAVHETGQDGAR